MKPDLTGYSDTVKVKLRRLKYETSTIASTIMEQYDISPLTRIVLELVPGMFIHSTLRKKNLNNKQKNINIFDEIRKNE